MTHSDGQPPPPLPLHPLSNSFFGNEGRKHRHDRHNCHDLIQRVAGAVLGTLWFSGLFCHGSGTNPHKVLAQEHLWPTVPLVTPPGHCNSAIPDWGGFGSLQERGRIHNGNHENESHHTHDAVGCVKSLARFNCARTLHSTQANAQKDSRKKTAMAN